MANLRSFETASELIEKMETLSTEEKQVLVIKKRLNKLIIERGYGNPSALSKEIENALDIKLNYTTIKDTLTEHKLKSLDMMCIIAICRYYDINISYILSDPDADNGFYENEDKYTSSKGFSILDDKSYFIKYHGYFYTPKDYKNYIDDFALEITQENDKTIAKLMVNYHSVNLDGNHYLKFKALTGTPILSNKSNIYIVFTESTGLFILLSFKYDPYPGGARPYFRRGTMVTFGQSANRPPLLQSFVMFDKELSKEDVERFIPGFLLLSDPAFHLPKNELQKLRKEHPEVEDLYNNYEDIFKHNHKTYYRLKESDFLSDNADYGRMSDVDVAKALLYMKSCATDAKRIYFPEPAVFTEFSKFLRRSPDV